MRLTPLTLALSTLSTTSAFISGITLPATIAPNKPYTITFDAKVDPYSMWTDVADSTQRFTTCLEPQAGTGEAGDDGAGWYSEV
ncbi:hypothetical protein COCC4DRAFT_46255 [Bipolaris maydis ATCC 48331]|uniref:Uncharacterized protein n=1 Tax=Cochliobolus heterostrophus (strain C4 / ATCC 48331 / race T) TaxID=665024 RepID=N4XBX2_COCH4|nr:uncharacterized protein COCC4DRAFT_46255 [Bipolaris maydis ATCC 48331]ENI10509.1 hypothetical protein COCC4DRAFT_46255 [Bipolaris maydis ATCC 48331]